MKRKDKGEVSVVRRRERKVDRAEEGGKEERLDSLATVYSLF